MAIGVDSLVALLHVTRPVSDRAGHEAGEDEVELCLKCPPIFKVVDVEADVGRYTITCQSPDC